MDRINTGKRYRKIIFILVWSLVLAALTVYRAVLQIHAGWVWVPDAGADDGLMITLAKSIEARRWLGTYSKVSMCKGIGYSLFLAGLHILHIPYPVGMTLLMALSSAFFVLAFRPFIRKAFRVDGGGYGNLLLSGVLYLLLLYNPIGFGSISAMRIYRTSVTGWIGLLVMSGFSGLYLRRKESWKKMLPWSAIGALSLSWLWNLREDSVWSLPFAVAAILLSMPACLSRRERGKVRMGKTLLTVFPLLLTGLSVLLISANNYKDYGIFGTNDRTKGSMAEMGSLLLDIDDGNGPNDRVFVSRDAMQIALDNSPALAGIEENLWIRWDRWAKEDGQVPGDHFYWTIRDAMEDSGYYDGNGRETDAFYRQAAAELQAAFDSGKIKKKDGIALSSQCRHFYPEDITGAFGQGLQVADQMQSYQNCEMGAFSIMDSTGLAGSWEEYLRMKVVDLTQEEQAENDRCIEWANRIISLYHKASAVTFVLAAFGAALTLICLLGALVRRKDGKSRISEDSIMFGQTLLITVGMGLSAYALIVVAILFSSWLQDGGYSFFLYGATGYLVFAAVKYLMILQIPAWIGRRVQRKYSR